MRLCLIRSIIYKVTCRCCHSFAASFGSVAFILSFIQIYGGPQLSHQIKITHIKLKLLTSNENDSHQIKITHIKLKLLTSN